MNNFYVPTVNSLGKTTFYFNGILDWDNLPNSIKQISGKLKFKIEVKKFLTQQQILDETSIWTI